ncbi:hypothetical protein GCM10025793_18950 [Lysobacter lycopersici]
MVSTGTVLGMGVSGVRGILAGRLGKRAQALESAGKVPLECAAAFPHPHSSRDSVMKVLSSLKSAKARHRDCKVVRRRGKVFVICKSNPRFKARQR